MIGYIARWFSKNEMPPAALRERSAGRCAGRIRCAKQRSGETERELFARFARSEFSLGTSANEYIRIAKRSPEVEVLYTLRGHAVCNGA